MHKFNSLFLLTTSLVLVDLRADSTPDPLSQVGTNLPARPVVKDGWNLFLNGEVLYWQAVEDNLTPIIQGFDGSDSSGNPTFRKIHSLDFEWNCGFRVSAGYNTPRDGWTLSAGWTSISNHAQAYIAQVLPPNPSQIQYLFQTWGDATHQLADGIFAARARLHIDLNQVDLQLGREFYFGKSLTILPRLGARTAWIDQSFSIFTQNNDAIFPSQLCKFHNNFWGFGFVAGIDTDWKFGKGFSLYSLSDFSILYGFFSVKEKFFFGFPPDDLNPIGTNIPSSKGMTLVSDWKNSLREATAVLDLGLGLKWAKLFHKERFGVTIKAGYEYHLYMDQNHFFNAFEKNASPPTNNLYIPQGGNLIYQGVSGSLQFDF